MNGPVPGILRSGFFRFCSRLPAGVFSQLAYFLSNNGEAEIIQIGDNNRRFEQFRVTAIQEIVEEGAIDLTLSKIENYYDVDLDLSETSFTNHENGHPIGGIR